jgi:hypothetical protein
MAKEKEKPAPAADAAEVAAKSRESLEESGIVTQDTTMLPVETVNPLVADVLAIPAVQTPVPVEQQNVAEKMAIAKEMRAAGWHAHYSRIHKSLVWKSPDKMTFEALQEAIPPDAAITHYNQGKKS